MILAMKLIVWLTGSKDGADQQTNRGQQNYGQTEANNEIEMRLYETWANWSLGQAKADFHSMVHVQWPQRFRFPWVCKSRSHKQGV